MPDLQGNDKSLPVKNRTPLSARPSKQGPEMHTPDDPSANAYDLLLALGLPFPTIEHPPLHTVEESQALRGEISGGHVKNLFVKDKGGNFFLITAGEDSPLDLKTMDKSIGAKGRVSFASAEQLMAHLGILPGSVSPLALVNDRAGVVRFILERKLLDHAVINVHPLINTRTSSIGRDDLLAFVRATGHDVTILDLPHRATAPPVMVASQSDDQ
jgi:Ala-tRNA(Pro) deacylase